MVVKRKIPIILIYFLFLTGFWPPLQAQVQRHGWNGVILKEVSPGVSVVREGATLPIYSWGMSLYEKDEVWTGENGRANIQFSSKGSGNEVILGPDTIVRISRTSSRFDYSIYKINVVKGKIWAKDLPSQSRKVQVNAGKSKIMPFGGEYVVEQFEDQTLAASSSGNIRVLDKLTNQYTPLQPGKIAAVSAKTGDLIIMPVSAELMNDFQSPSEKSGKSSNEIRRIVSDRIERIDEILAEEARVEAEKKALAEARRLEKEDAERFAAEEMERKEQEEYDRRTREAVLKKQQEEDAARQVRMEIQKKEREATEKALQVAAAAAPATGMAAVKAQEATPGQKMEQAAAPGESRQQSSQADGQVASEPQEQPAAELAQKTEQPALEQKADQQAVTPEQQQKQAEMQPTESAGQQQEALSPKEQQSPVQVVQQEKSQESAGQSETASESIASPPKKKEEESLLQTFKWDIVTLSTAVVFSWLSTEEAKKFNNLESKNETLQSQWAAATTTTARTDLEVQYEVNKSKMSTYKANVSLYNNIAILAVIFEGYLIYQHIFGDDPSDLADSRSYDRRSTINPDTIRFGFNDPSSPSGVRLSLGWKW